MPPVSVEREDDAPSALLRLSAAGEVVDLEGAPERLVAGLRFGDSIFGPKVPRHLQDCMRAAAQSYEASHFRILVGNREWLCRVEPSPDGVVLLRATGLPPSPGGELAPAHRVGRFIDDVPVHVSVADARERGRILVWNRHSEAMFGYAAAEALEQLTARDLFTTESDFLAMLAAVECGAFDGACVLRRKDGSTFTGRMLVVGRRDASGSIVERCTVVEDIGHRERDEHELPESGRGSGHDDRIRLMGQLAGGIAHDFNNLLTAIMSSAELLEVQCRDVPGASEDLEVITSAARSASSLTRRLLTFSRNKVEAPRRIDVASWFSELLTFLTRLVPERVRFQHAMEGAGSIRIDPNELEQVVLNLVVNAVGAMPQGGSLTLRCRCVDGRMLLEVEDSGVGVPADLQERIFEPFFTTRAEGTGLGLATARAIVRRAGGEIWVLSAADSGARFSISIPLTDGEPDRPVPPSTEAPAADDGRGVALLVEDQSDVRYAVERLLRSMGYQVRAEPDVQAGKRALEEMATCALLLTDYMLPDGTGLDLIDDARAIFPSARAVLMSGYLQELEAADESFDRLIAKPFSRSQLWELLASLDGEPAQ